MGFGCIRRKPALPRKTITRGKAWALVAFAASRLCPAKQSQGAKHGLWLHSPQAGFAPQNGERRCHEKLNFQSYPSTAKAKFWRGRRGKMMGRQTAASRQYILTSFITPLEGDGKPCGSGTKTGILGLTLIRQVMSFFCNSLIKRK